MSFLDYYSLKLENNVNGRKQQNISPNNVNLMSEKALMSQVGNGCFQDQNIGQKFQSKN